MAKHKGRGIATIEYPTGMNQNGDPSQAWVKLKPDVWTWPADRAKINKFAAPGAPADASAQLQIPPWTTYTLRQYRACQGP